MDAICINQDDLAEREQQVRLMPGIYHKANRVLVWLGDASDAGDQALNDVCASADDSSSTGQTMPTFKLDGVEIPFEKGDTITVKHELLGDLPAEVRWACSGRVGTLFLRQS